MSDFKDNDRFWRSVSSAIDAEYRTAKTIRGISGIDHRVQAISVDDKTKRVIIVSAEASPRLAALMQVDVQATMPEARVLVARPLLFDISTLSKRLLASDLQLSELATAIAQPESKERQSKIMGDKLREMLDPLVEVARRIEIPVATQFIGLAQQVVELNWQEHMAKQPDMNGVLSVFKETLTTDSGASDRALGICPVPLYELKGNDWDLLLAGTRGDDIRQRLKELGIFQYFFPAPDHLLLGLTDEHIAQRDTLIKAAERSPDVGHPLGEAEMFKDARTFVDFLESLTEAGYIAETEFGYTTTARGKQVRQSVKVRPREGTIQKLSKLFKARINITVKSLLG